MATSGRGTGRSRPRGGAGPSRRPQPRRSRRRVAGRTPDVPARRRPRFTGRMAIVVVVLAVLFVSYATSLRAFLGQRAHIDDLETQIAQDQQAIAELREEQRRWRDEAYVEAQARERFGWVLPGEVGLRVIGEDGRPLDARSELTDPASLGRDPDSEWWTATVTSLQLAGEDPDAGPGPASRLGPPVKRKGDADQRRGGTAGGTAGDVAGDVAAGSRDGARDGGRGR